MKGTDKDISVSAWCDERGEERQGYQVNTQQRLLAHSLMVSELRPRLTRSWAVRTRRRDLCGGNSMCETSEARQCGSCEEVRPFGVSGLWKSGGCG